MRLKSLLLREGGSRRLRERDVDLDLGHQLCFQVPETLLGTLVGQCWNET